MAHTLVFGQSPVCDCQTSKRNYHWHRSRQAKKHSIVKRQKMQATTKEFSKFKMAYRLWHQFRSLNYRHIRWCAPYTLDAHGKQTHWSCSKSKVKMKMEKEKRKALIGNRGGSAQWIIIYLDVKCENSHFASQEESWWTNDVVWRVCGTFFHWKIRLAILSTFSLVHSIATISFGIIAPTYKNICIECFKLEIHDA